MAELEELLREDRRASAARMIATDGVFSMDGYLAQLDAICDLADKYDAMVMVDDSPRDRLHRRQRAAARPSTAAWAAGSTS